MPAQPTVASANSCMLQKRRLPPSMLLFVITFSPHPSRTIAEVAAKLMYAQLNADAATWHDVHVSVCMQVVAGLLHDEFPSAIIRADQVAAPNYLFTQHLDNAQKPGTAQWETLGPNSTDHWDFVLFQVRYLVGSFSYCQ